MDKFIIYRITNNINGKTYIGQHKTKDIMKDDGYMGSGIILHRAYDKYGIENFTKTIITFGMSQSEINVLEKFYIEKERRENKNGCYNIADGGYSITNGFKGHHHSEESKQKNRDKHLGKIPGNKGKKLTDEQRKYISEKCKGKNIGQKAWNKGLHKRFSNGTLGKHWELDIEAKSKISETLKSKHRHWYTNGTKNVCSEKCPEGYWEGRIING